jgi:AcrR family transcriptional regulator
MDEPVVVGMSPEPQVRERILRAAFGVFVQHGYARASTLQIATLARVSKRELYAQFGSKRAMLAACISDRARNMRPPQDLPPPSDRDTLRGLLIELGTRLLLGVSDPDVVAVYRLAMPDAPETDEVAEELDRVRDANLAAVADILSAAQARGMLPARDPARQAADFLSLLLGDIPVRLLLGVASRPTPAEARGRATHAADIVLAQPSETA